MPSWMRAGVMSLAVIAPVLAAAVTATPAGAEQPARRTHSRRAAPAPVRTPVRLQAQPGTELDRTARRLILREMADSSRSEPSLVLVGSAQLAVGKTTPAVFVQVQSPMECGSSGCSTTVFMNDRKILDSVSGSIVVDGQKHRGMYDLIVGDGERFVWDGTAYRSTEGAPAVNLRPRRPHPAR